MREREREREREAETQAEEEAGSMQGALCGTQSRVSRITPQAAGGTKPLCHRGCPAYKVKTDKFTVGVRKVKSCYNSKGVIPHLGLFMEQMFH